MPYKIDPSASVNDASQKTVSPVNNGGIVPSPPIDSSAIGVALGAAAGVAAVSNPVTQAVLVANATREVAGMSIDAQMAQPQKADSGELIAHTGGGLRYMDGTLGFGEKGKNRTQYLRDKRAVSADYHDLDRVQDPRKLEVTVPWVLGVLSILTGLYFCLLSPILILFGLPMSILGIASIVQVRNAIHFKKKVSAYKIRRTWVRIDLYIIACGAAALLFQISVGLWK